ncbi:MAG: RHS repeat domain-containing protein, partial [Cyanobacteria bacterium P01_C01_bin.147]
LDHLRSLLPPSVQMTSYLYQVGIGISEIMDPNGWPTGYSYDAFGRLQAITEHHGDLLTEYDNATALESK